MVADEFPDPQSADLNLDAPCFDEGWTTFVFCGQSTNIYFPEHYGPLSIKSTVTGAETYRLEGMTYQVQPASYLILNEGQRYSSWIDDGGKKVESFCLFFNNNYAADVIRTLQTDHRTLLDEPFAASASHIPHFIEKLYPKNDSIALQLNAIHCLIKEGATDILLLDNHFRSTIAAMMADHRETTRQAERLDVVRHTTRVELYRRLHYAKDYMDSVFTTHITLQQIAAVACLSVHHFVRLFKSVFFVPPYEYLIRRRIEYAERQLRDTHLSVAEIGNAAGFDNLSTFSRMFRKYNGLPPTAYRSQITRNILKAAQHQNFPNEK